MNYHHKKKKSRVTKNILIIILILFLCSCLYYLLSSIIVIFNSVRAADADITAIPEVLVEPPKPHLYLDIKCSEDEILCNNKCIKKDINNFCKT